MSIIIGLKLSDRIEIAVNLQKILSKYGCNIKTRIGLHDINNGKCSDCGIILLEFIGNNNLLNVFIKELSAIEYMDVKIMNFD